MGVLIFKNGSVLIGKRIGSHGAGMYETPGGHLEYMESFQESIYRELEEECGVKIKNFEFLCIINSKKYAPKHYIDVGFKAEWLSGDPEVLEPDKKVAWEWADINNLPDPLFTFLEDYVRAYRTGKLLFDDTGGQS